MGNGCLLECLWSLISVIDNCMDYSIKKSQPPVLPASVFVIGSSSIILEHGCLLACLWYFISVIDNCIDYSVNKSASCSAS